MKTLVRRRGASMLETAIAVPVLLGVVWAVYVLFSFFWAGTVMTTTGDVAALSAQTAYDARRLGPGVLQGQEETDNLRLARDAAVEAARMVAQSAQGMGAIARTDFIGCTRDGSPAPLDWVNVDAGEDATSGVRAVTVNLTGRWRISDTDLPLLPTFSSCITTNGVASTMGTVEP